MESKSPVAHPFASKAHTSNRPKIPKDARKRVSSACQRCKTRRIKCSGDRPCKNCEDAESDCVYPPDEKRIFIAESYVLGLEERKNTLEEQVRVLEERLKGVSQSPMERFASPRTRTRTASSSTSECPDPQRIFDVFAEEVGKLLVDPSGHARYIGDSASAAYIDRVRAFVKEYLYPDADFSHYLNLYHTWDSRPIQFAAREPFALPARAIATSLINSLFVCYPPDIFYLVHPAVLSQLLEDCFRDPAHNYSVLALVNASLALGAQASGIAETTVPGMDFFGRVKLLLATVAEDNNIMSVQVLNILSLFLVGANRRDAAYTYIGLAMRIALAHGLHRRSAQSQNLSPHVHENNVRIWWTTYFIERSMELLLGRPPQIRDDDIDAEMPAEHDQFPSPEGLIAHAGLATIMGQIVSDVYRTRRRNKEDVDETLLSLNGWKATLPISLQMNYEEPLLVVPSRSILLLHLMYNQLILVTLRMSIIDYIMSQANDLFNPDPKPPYSMSNPHLIPSIEAARQNLKLSEWLMPLSPYTFHSFHYVFSAAIAIVVQSFLANETPHDAELVDQAVSKLAELGRTNESAESCAKMTRDLRVVVENVKMVRDGTRQELARLSISPMNRGEEDNIMFWSVPSSGFN